MKMKPPSGPKKQSQFKKSQNEYKLNYNKGLQKKRGFCSPNKQTQFLQKPKMNVNLYVIEDYENENAHRPKKTNPNKPNFRKAKMNLKSLAGKSGHTPTQRDLIVPFTRNHLFGIM